VRVWVWGDKPYPLFPCDNGEAERQDIQFVTFRRLRKDHTIEIPEALDFKFAVGDWRDVLMWLGAGIYQAIGFDAHHRVVAEYPRSERGWLLVCPAQEPHICSIIHNPPPAVEALHPSPAAAPPPPPAPAPVEPGLEARFVEALRPVVVEVAKTLLHHHDRIDRLEQVLLATLPRPVAPEPRGKPN
jgi:hypothetical protein